MTRNMFFIKFFFGLFAMAFCLWYWLKDKIDGNVKRKEAEWKRQEKKARRNHRRSRRGYGKIAAN